MKNRTALTAIIFLLIASMCLVAWTSYWAGFSKSLEISSYINQRHELSLSGEYKHWAVTLDSGNIQKVRSDLQSLSDMLKEQAAARGGEPNSLLDLVFPTEGLSLLRDYNANRDRMKVRQESPKPW